jgi:putative colanic acid biosynthesis acetyltransferase WcaF
VTERNLAGFTGAGYDKGRNVIWQALWVATSSLVIERTWCPAKLRILIPRAYDPVRGLEALGG